MVSVAGVVKERSESRPQSSARHRHLQPHEMHVSHENPYDIATSIAMWAIGMTAPIGIVHWELVPIGGGVVVVAVVEIVVAKRGEDFGRAYEFYASVLGELQHAPLQLLMNGAFVRAVAVVVVVVVAVVVIVAHAVAVDAIDFASVNVVVVGDGVGMDGD